MLLCLPVVSGGAGVALGYAQSCGQRRIDGGNPVASAGLTAGRLDSFLELPPDGKVSVAPVNPFRCILLSLACTWPTRHWPVPVTDNKYIYIYISIYLSLVRMKIL